MTQQEKEFKLNTLRKIQMVHNAGGVGLSRDFVTIYNKPRTGGIDTDGMLFIHKDTDNKVVDIYIANDVTRLPVIPYIYKAYQYLGQTTEKINYIGGKNVLGANFIMSDLTDINLNYDIDFSALCTDSLISINNMFTNYIKEGELDLTTLDTSGVSKMDDVFRKCICNSINVSNWNTIRVISMNGMFQHFRTFGKLDISNWDTRCLETAYAMFAYAEAYELKQNLDTSNCEDLGFMFTRSNIKELDLRNFNISKVKNMSGIFSECNAEIINLETWKTTEKLRKAIVRQRDYGFQMFSGYNGRIIANDKLIIQQFEKDTGREYK